LVVWIYSSVGLLKPRALEAAKGSRENDIASVDNSPSVQSSSLTAARSLFLSALSDTDRLFRRNGVGGAESNSTTPEAQRNSSNISIRFNKKAAEDSEDESEPVLAIKIPPAPAPAESTEPGEAEYVNLVENHMRIKTCKTTLFFTVVLVFFCVNLHVFFVAGFSGRIFLPFVNSVFTCITSYCVNIYYTYYHQELHKMPAQLDFPHFLPLLN